LSIDLYCEIYPEIADRHPISLEQWQEWFANWEPYLRSQLAIADGEYELTLAITDDLTIQQLNLQYRQQDRPTDVLSFAALESDVPEIPDDDAEYLEPTCLGDIIISQTTAIRQAEERGHSLTYELAWLAAHGLLHLLGWDHPDEDSLEAMLKQQDLMLQLILL
jgi:probable rRNA maturation factor